MKRDDDIAVHALTDLLVAVELEGNSNALWFWAVDEHAPPETPNTEQPK